MLLRILEPVAHFADSVSRPWFSPPLCRFSPWSTTTVNTKFRELLGYLRVHGEPPRPVPTNEMFDAAQVQVLSGTAVPCFLNGIKQPLFF